MPITYLPNPPGTLPYKQGAGQVAAQGFSQGIEKAAGVIDEYYKRKRQMAQQTFQNQFALAQAGLPVDAKKMIKAGKAIGISLGEKDVQEYQAQLKQTRQAETAKAVAEAGQAEAQTQLTQQQVELGKQRVGLANTIQGALKSKDPSALAGSILQAKILGVPGLKDLNASDVLSEANRTPEQWNKIVAQNEATAETGLNPAQRAELAQRDKEFNYQVTQDTAKNAFEYAKTYGVSLGTAVKESQNPASAPPRVPLSVKDQQFAQEMQTKQLGEEEQRTQIMIREQLDRDREAGARVGYWEAQANYISTKKGSLEPEERLKFNMLSTIARNPKSTADERTQAYAAMGQLLGVKTEVVQHFFGLGRQTIQLPLTGNLPGGPTPQDILNQSTGTQ
jgi:hypothetical protein